MFGGQQGGQFAVFGVGERQPQAVGQGGEGQDAAGCALRVGADGVRRDVARIVGVG